MSWCVCVCCLLCACVACCVCVRVCTCVCVHIYATEKLVRSLGTRLCVCLWLGQTLWLYVSRYCDSLWPAISILHSCISPSSLTAVVSNIKSCLRVESTSHIINPSESDCCQLAMFGPGPLFHHLQYAWELGWWLYKTNLWKPLQCGHCCIDYSHVSVTYLLIS